MRYGYSLQRAIYLADTPSDSDPPTIGRIRDGSHRQGETETTLVSGTTHRTHTSTSGIATALTRVESITVLQQGGC